MKVESEKQKNSRVKLTVTLEPKELVAHFRTAYEKIAPTVKIDGFRPGMAPYKVIETAVGYNRLLSEGIDIALRDSYVLAIAKEKLVPLAPPEVNVKKAPGFSLDANEIKDDFIYEANVDIMPEVSLGDYSKLKMKPAKKEEPKAEDVEKILDQLRKQKATFLEVKRGAKKGDRVELNYDGFLKGVRIDRMCSKNHPLVLGEGNLIPGFEDQVTGMEKGEKKKIKVKFPKDYHDKELADKNAEFEVELAELREIVLPELDDKFSSDFGHKNIKDLRDAIEKNLKMELNQNYENKLELDAMEKILPLLKVEIPEVLILEETEQMMIRFKEQIEKNGINFDQYLGNIKKSAEDIQKDMRPQAEKNVKIGLILGKIIDEKKFDPRDKASGKKAIDYLVKKLTS